MGGIVFFLCFHCGLIKSAVISTWGESYLKLNITRNAIAALTPFSSMSLALYIIIMVTSTIDFLAYIPSRSQVPKFSLQLQSESV